MAERQTLEPNKVLQVIADILNNPAYATGNMARQYGQGLQQVMGLPAKGLDYLRSTQPAIQGAAGFSGAPQPTPEQMMMMQQAIRTPQPPPVQQQPSPQVQAQPEAKTPFWQSNLGNAIKRIGPPLAAAGVGAAFPNALPGAAGFATGYSGETQRQQEMGEKEPAEKLARLKSLSEIEENLAQAEKAKRSEMSGSDFKAAMEGLDKSASMMEKLSGELSKRKKELLEKYLIQTGGTSTQQSKVSEVNIQYTMKKHNLTREEVLQRIGSQ